MRGIAFATAGAASEADGESIFAVMFIRDFGGQP